jgi:hypothetical protein
MAVSAGSASSAMIEIVRSMWRLAADARRGRERHGAGRRP